MHLTDKICPGASVTIRTPHNQERTGRAVMKGPYGWVLNRGGRYGTQGGGDETNTVNYLAHRR